MTRTSRTPTALGLLLALCAALLLVPATTAPAQAAPAVQRWGSTSAPDQLLRGGCHPYRYRYVVDPPTDDWMAEIFLVGPGRVGLAHATLFSDSEKARGRRVWRLCSPSLRTGRYVMKMKITYLDGDDETSGRVRNSRFRLTARR